MPTLRQAAPCGHAGSHQAVAEQVYPAAPESARQARRFVAAALDGWGLAATADAGALITSELAANAARQGAATYPAELLVRVTQDRGLVVIEVGDHDSTTPPRHPRKAGADAEHGRGLALVRAVSARVAWYREGTWKIVWAAIPVPDGQRPALPYWPLQEAA